MRFEKEVRVRGWARQLILFSFLGLPWVAGMPQAVTRELAEEVHRRAIVVDGHSDTLWRVLDQGVDIGVRTVDGHMDLPRMREGGIDAQFFAIWPAPEYGPHYIRRTLRLIDALKEVVARYPDQIEHATSVEDIERISSEGRIAALMGIEGGHAIENDLGVLRAYYELGVRYLTLTWSVRTDWADSSSAPERWMGLNRFGERVVKEMNRLGMLVDISHVSDDTFWDTLRVTRAPVIASHSSVRSISNHTRNMNDEMIAAMHENGGVIMINFASGFLDEGFRLESKRKNREFKGRFSELGEEYLGDPVGYLDASWRLYREIHSQIESPPLDRVVDHIDRVVELAGIDHVGLGSDFDGVTSLPRGLEDCSKLPNLTRALLDRGYREEQVDKILGGNLLRVFREVEKIAGRR
ncbi:MAG: dipeptidase [Acidobacteriota bacterium]